MNRPRRAAAAVVAVVLGLLPVLAGGASAGPLPRGEDTGRITGPQPPADVRITPRQVVVGPGQRLTFRSTVTGRGGRPGAGYVAALTILSSDPDVYVDPEDWSPRRTQYVGALPAGATRQLRWTVRAVTSGPLILYVAVTDPRTGAVATSDALRMQVAGQRVVNPQHVLPLLLWMPLGVLVVLAATVARRRRLT